ncbi:monovalent cation/H(+) antiporter subunit G [Myroides marinus]|jgi:multicomponent Na+:H+ antiporter subunit G|uniref:Multicomponent Na+:H+ antiporter subunit G n=1 Tax=Myroides marinus TaxID=703342 RepID=A0A161UB27_9FLAO|nr:monovalent cation/H(+) antiporter subunit G [Myroides marinus]MDR0195626.1 monovalent cation/H(+) antiporter subunit G [Myroides sp.]KZE83547.1 sodium:proton antiporter [Myroides marinus]MDM1346292.1 monovalent cation/H(+) antiporter subunit G [Myroides marinus]MDM1349451.1 monovalent cation/H(+) antiporter subunit G [Myroides marinus]MDM1353890.1 monovalent cation/H(+) antiporter subunit G [Myroides marinus]
MTDILIMILSTVGAIFVLISSIGIVRMPDFYTRLSITIKAATLGIGCILTAAAIHFAEFSTTTKVLAIVFFLFITSPVAAFLIARSAYISGIKLWKRSVVDELQDKYDNKNEIPVNPCKEEGEE